VIVGKQQKDSKGEAKVSEDTPLIRQHHILYFYHSPCQRGGSALAGSREEPSLSLGQCMNRNGCRHGPRAFKPRGEHTIEGVASAAMRGLRLARKRTHHHVKFLLCMFAQARETPHLPVAGR